MTSRPVWTLHFSLIEWQTFTRWCKVTAETVGHKFCCYKKTKNNNTMRRDKGVKRRDVWTDGG